jgi:hypothetical protein
MFHLRRAADRFEPGIISHPEHACRACRISSPQARLQEGRCSVNLEIPMNDGIRLIAMPFGFSQSMFPVVC